MKVTDIKVLLCLVSVMEVYSQTVPYVTFMDITLTNHSYVNLTLVGRKTNGSDSVQCHTDLSTCCSISEGVDRGDWYGPNRDRLLLAATITSIYYTRKAQRVDLRRHNNGDLSGIYRCDIKTVATSENGGQETVYVGLYASGGDIVVSVGISFVKDSQLDKEIPKFTLTCISTGDPATTVTWTRDSETVSGGITVLDDPVTAQYTHKLTVTGRLGGQYECIVSNNKPSQDSAALTVQVASAPSNVMVVQEGSTGIRVSWTPPTPLGDTTGYRIYYSGCSSGSVDVTGGSTDSHLLTGLQNGASYNISIVGTSQHLHSNRVDYPNSISLSETGHVSCEYTVVVGGGVAGGFVGGVITSAVVGVIVCVVLGQRMRIKVDKHPSLSEFVKTKNNQISTSANVSYGEVNREEGEDRGGDGGYAICDPPHGAVIATEESLYETVPA